MIILSLHILFSVFLIVMSAGVMISALEHRVTRLYRAMMGAFGLTFISGVSLLFVGGGIGRICATMGVVSLGVLLLHRYYTLQIAITTP